MSAIDSATLVQGLIAWMRQEGVAVTRTRLMKFIYLADLHHARHHEGATITGWRWYVHSFGPMANEAYVLLDRGVREGWLTSNASSSSGEEGEPSAIFYDIVTKGAAEQLHGMGKVHRWIKTLGDDTPRLLRFVYGNTEPMVDAKEGEYLDFSSARPTDNVAPIHGRKPTRKEEKRFEEISKRLRARYEAAQASNAKIVDGPRDDAYFNDLPAEGASVNGDMILLFDKER
ncbi:MAG: hypothetical protein U0359_41755 [Byssovorax sp.]